MTSRLTHTLKNQLFVYLVVAALAIATPEFAGRAEAQEDSGFYFMMEGRLAIPGGDQTAYVEIVHADTDAVLVEDIDAEFGGGGRIGGAYRTKQWDFGIFYSGLHVSGETDSSAQAPMYLYPVLGVGFSPYDTAFSEAEATYHILDFEAAYNFKLGQADVRLFGGLRYANFDQDVNTSFDYAPRAYNVVEKRDVDFWGIGFRFGAGAHKPLSGPWGVAGAVSGGVLFGDQDTLTTQQQTGGGFIDDTQVSRSDGRTAGFVDGEMGVTYSRETTNATNMVFTFGYRAESWFDVNNTQSEPPTKSGQISGTINIYGTMYADQIFHGPFLRGEWRFK